MTKKGTKWATKDRWVAVDFDGVLAHYDGFKGADVLGEPIDGASAGTAALRAQGWKILVWTTRPKTPALIAWLDQNQITYDAVNEDFKNPPGASTKPCVDAWLDDRSVNFGGDWAHATNHLKDFKPWHKKVKK